MMNSLNHQLNIKKMCIKTFLASLKHFRLEKTFNLKNSKVAFFSRIKNLKNHSKLINEKLGLKNLVQRTSCKYSPY